MSIRREIDIEATPEEVWDALATDEGRERWLEGDEREVLVEVVEEPRRLVWWWAGNEAWSRVEITLVPAVAATRVVVVESAPAFPLTTLRARLSAVPA
jgi:uncharacterized protein YndB with AHSA1/START domain